jgi:uncharacterized protein YbjT (DUF2867 family)
MKITITGSIGHIGRPLTEILVKKGHAVTVISSRAEKQKDIESLGAKAAIGSVEDAGFLAASFAGAEAVYTMVPPANYFSPDIDPIAYSRRIGSNYARAIQESGVRRIVHLSSVGAHLDKGSGLILGHHDVEVILKKLSGVSVTYLRPVGFYYNLYSFLAMIKKEGIIAANYGADEMLIWVDPSDIAEVIAEELESAGAHGKIRYVASDELTGNETARILGAAIGKPDLKWIIIPGEQMEHGLVAAGLNPHVAAGLVEMFASQHSGVLTADYYRNKPAVMGKVKLADFAKEFAVAFQQNG